ncbi:MAG: DUF6531 domain-containing protein [Planctomycetota bacterium]
MAHQRVPKSRATRGTQQKSVSANSLPEPIQEPIETEPVDAFKGTSNSQHLEAVIDGGSILLSSTRPEKTWQVANSLEEIGRGEFERVLDSGEVQVDGATMRVERKGVTELYANSEDGIEHGWVVHEREGGGEEPLKICLKASAGSIPCKVSDISISFCQLGQHVMGFSRLYAEDADGRVLLARFEVEGQEVDIVVEDQGARYPILVDPTYTEYLYFNSPNVGPGGGFGGTMAVLNDELLVSATGANGGRGAAFLYKKVANSLVLEQAFSPSDLNTNDYFSAALAFDGSVMVIGAYNQDVGFIDAGAAYIFEKQNGVWVQVQKVTAGDPHASDWFGAGVAIDQGRILIGATKFNGAVADMGCVYVFKKIGGVWTQAQQIVSPFSGGAEQLFGYPIVSNKGEVYFGARSEDSVAQDSGALFVYEYDGSSYQFSQKLKPSGIQQGQSFHWPVLNGNQMFVAAHGDPALSRTGRVYVYNHNGTQWVEGLSFTSPDVGPEDLFGFGISTYDNAVIVGARFDNSNGTTRGRAYVFRDHGSGWVQDDIFETSLLSLGDQFGYAVEVIENFVLISSGYEDINNADDGAIFAFNMGPAPSNGDMNFLDDFSRANSLNVGNFWTEINDDNGGEAQIVGNELSLNPDLAGPNSTVGVAHAVNVSHQDVVRVSFRFKIPAIEVGENLRLELVDMDDLTENMIWASFTNATTSLHTLASPDVTNTLLPQPGVYYNAELEVDPKMKAGDHAMLYLWAAGPKPAQPLQMVLQTTGTDIFPDSDSDGFQINEIRFIASVPLILDDVSVNSLPEWEAGKTYRAGDPTFVDFMYRINASVVGNGWGEAGDTTLSGMRAVLMGSGADATLTRPVGTTDDDQRLLFRMNSTSLANFGAAASPAITLTDGTSEIRLHIHLNGIYQSINGGPQTLVQAVPILNGLDYFFEVISVVNGAYSLRVWPVGQVPPAHSFNVAPVLNVAANLTTGLVAPNAENLFLDTFLAEGFVPVTDPDFVFSNPFSFGFSSGGSSIGPQTATLTTSSGTPDPSTVTIEVMQGAMGTGIFVPFTTVANAVVINTDSMIEAVRESVGFTGSLQNVDLTFSFPYYSASGGYSTWSEVKTASLQDLSPPQAVVTPKLFKPNASDSVSVGIIELGYGLDAVLSNLKAVAGSVESVLLFDGVSAYTGSITAPPNVVLRLEGLLTDIAGNQTPVSAVLGQSPGIPQFNWTVQGGNAILTVVGTHMLSVSATTGTLDANNLPFVFNGSTATATLPAGVGSHPYVLSIQYQDLPGFPFPAAGSLMVSGPDSGTNNQTSGTADSQASPVTGTQKPPGTGQHDEINDPVNSFTGAFMMQVTDLRIPGRGIDFVWSRSYDSNITYLDSELGTTWTSPYLARLIDVKQNGNDGDIDFKNGRGRIDRFTYSAPNWTSPAHHYLQLTLNVKSSEFILKGDGDLEHRFHDFTHATAPGRLSRIRDRFGNQISFQYGSTGLLTGAVDTYGRAFTFSHNAAGLITGVTDFSGRTVAYAYHSFSEPGGLPGDLKSATSPAVTGHPYGNVFPSGKTTIYTYNRFHPNADARRGIVSITDGKGQTYLTNTWSATANPADFLFKRVMRQTYGGGTFVNHYTNQGGLPYGAVQASVVNDRRGVVKAIYMNALGNPLAEERYTGFAVPGTEVNLAGLPALVASRLRPSDPAFFLTRKTFDAQGKPLVTTLPRGNTVASVYNTAATERHGEDNPLEVRRADGSLGTDPDLVSSMTYEPIYQLVKTMTDPKGKVTTYFYDYEEGTAYLNQDLNGDGIFGASATNKGLLIRVNRPDVTVGLSAIDAGGTQVSFEQLQYNAFGQLVLHIDGEGRRVAYTYHPNNDPDGDGVTVPGNADAAPGGYLKEVIVDPQGLALTTSHLFDAVGNVKTITDPRGNPTSYLVNQLNQVMRINSPVMDDRPEDGGAVYEKVFFYDANDNVEKIWTELENAKDDGIAAVPGFSSPNHFEVEFTYDALDNVITRRVEALAAVGMSPALVTTYFYDPSENMVRIRYPNNDEDAIAYDERDLTFRSTIGDADLVVAKSVTTVNYDANGNVLERLHPNPNHRLAYGYDGFDRLSSFLHDGIDTSVAFGYDANSNVTDRTITGAKNGGGAQITLADVETLFDELNRPYESRYAVIDHESATQTGTAISKVGFDRNSQVVKAVNPNNHQSLVAYDGANRTDTVTDAVNNILKNIYDANSNVIESRSTEIQHGGAPQVFHVFQAYDELNRLRRTEDDLANVTTAELDSRGLPARRVDAEGNVVEGEFDGLGRRFEENRQVGPGDFATLRWVFDDRSRMVLCIDGLQRETAFGFDSHNRLTSRTNADLTERLYQWDTEDNLTRLTRENGHKVDHLFDDANRMTRRTYRDASEAEEIRDVFEYNGLGALTRAAEETGGNPGNGTRYERDSRGLALRCRQTIVNPVNGVPYPEKVFAAVHDLAGNPTQMGYAGGRTADFNAYSAIELVGNITTQGFDGAATLASWDYDGYGRVAERSFGNGVDLVQEYDAVKRIQSMVHAVGARTHASFVQSYDKVHNRRSETFTATDLLAGQAKVWAYDDHYRNTGFIRGLDPASLPAALADFAGNVGPGDGKDFEEHEHDDANNLTSLTVGSETNPVTVNEMNEITEMPGVRNGLLYDDLGRLTEYYEVIGAGGIRRIRLIWNARDQLVRQETWPGLNDEFEWVPLGEYTYFPDGMRATKKVTHRASDEPLGEVVKLRENYYGTGMMIHEVWGADGVTGAEDVAPKQEFVHEGLDRPLAMFTNADKNAATGTLGGREAYFYHCNPRGDVMALTNESGHVMERYDYSQYGAVRTTGGYDPSAVIYSDVADDVFTGPYNGSAQNYGQIEVYNAPRGFLKNELAGHYIGFTIAGQLRYFKILANASFTDSLYTNAIVVAEDLIALGVMDLSTFVIVPPFDAPKADTLTVIHTDSASDVYTEPGVSILEDQGPVGHAKHAMRGNFIEFTTGGFTYRMRIADNESFDQGGGVFINVYRLDHENLEIFLTVSQNFTVIGPKASYTLEWILPRQTGTADALSGIPGHCQIDDYDGTIDWMDGELTGWEIEFELNGMPIRFPMIGNFTNRTPDPEVMYNGYSVAADLATLGVLEGARYKIYAPRQTMVGNPHHFGGAWLDHEDVTDSRYWMRHRYYSANMRGFISRDPAEDDSLGNLYAAFERNAGTYSDPWGLDTYWIGGAGDAEPFNYGIDTVGPTHIMKHVMEQRKGMFPADLDNHYYGYDDEELIFQDIVKRHESVKKGKPKVVNLIGHSLGGAAAMRITNRLIERGIKVNILLTLDPVQKIGAAFTGTAANQEYWGNIYQRQTLADCIITGLPYIGQILVGLPNFIVTKFDDAVATVGGSLGHEVGANYNKSKRRSKEKSLMRIDAPERKYVDGKTVETGRLTTYEIEVDKFAHSNALSFFDKVIQSVPGDLRSRVYEK